MKAVLDSNVLISAFLFFNRDSAPAQLLRHLAAGRFCMCTCGAILNEVQGVLLRERTQERYGYPRELVAQFRLTLAAQADCIVSRDDDLRCLNAFEGIPIYAPRAFLERLEAMG